MAELGTNYHTKYETRDGHYDRTPFLQVRLPLKVLSMTAKTKRHPGVSSGRRDC